MRTLFVPFVLSARARSRRFDGRITEAAIRSAVAHEAEAGSSAGWAGAA